MLKVPWTAQITNEEVIRRISLEPNLLKIIKIRKATYLSPILRHDNSIPQVIMWRSGEERKEIGMKKMS